jgi:hypothetical protein
VLVEVQAEVTNRPADSAFIPLLDFDGTLAEFNPDPAAPQLTPERWDLIERISTQPGVAVGIVSGLYILEGTPFHVDRPIFFCLGAGRPPGINSGSAAENAFELTVRAAATTSIPEAIGSGRTWDYRYCWLRDSAFVVEALRRLSHLSEGEAFVRFLREMADSGPLQRSTASPGSGTWTKRLSRN